mgnify:CR=1 FL=1
MAEKLWRRSKAIAFRDVDLRGNGCTGELAIHLAQVRTPVISSQIQCQFHNTVRLLPGLEASVVAHESTLRSEARLMVQGKIALIIEKPHGVGG